MFDRLKARFSGSGCKSEARRPVLTVQGEDGLLKMEAICRSQQVYVQDNRRKTGGVILRITGAECCSTDYYPSDVVIQVGYGKERQQLEVGDSWSTEWIVNNPRLSAAIKTRKAACSLGGKCKGCPRFGES
jgi:hypothetical protein